VTPVTLVASASTADVSYMVVAADPLDDLGSAVSPELVLVDAALSAEVRHLLVVPEDTLERLERDGDRPRRASQAMALPPEPSDVGLTDHEHSESSKDELEPPESGTAPELADPIRRDDVPSAGHVIEHETPDESDQRRRTSNTYPALPSPAPEDSQEDATDAVLRLITRSA
jgi:hypothetical protein